MKRIIFFTVIVCLVLSFVSCNSQPTTTDQTAAQQTLSDFVNAVNSEDKNTMLTYFSKDLTQTIQSIDPLGDLSAQGLFSLLSGLYLTEDYFELTMSQQDIQLLENSISSTQEVILKSGNHEEERILTFVFVEEDGWKISSINQVS